MGAPRSGPVGKGKEPIRRAAGSFIDPADRRGRRRGGALSSTYRSGQPLPPASSSDPKRPIPAHTDRTAASAAHRTTASSPRSPRIRAPLGTQQSTRSRRYPTTSAWSRARKYPGTTQKQDSPFERSDAPPHRHNRISGRYRRILGRDRPTVSLRGDCGSRRCACWLPDPRRVANLTSLLLAWRSRRRPLSARR